MKTEKELQELQQQCRDFQKEYQELQEKLKELSNDELQKVTGGFLPVFIGFP